MDRQPDFWGHRERAEEARSVLESPIYGMAVTALRETYYAELMKLPMASPNVFTVHAKLKVLDEVSGQLEHYINDFKFKRKQEA